MANVETEGGFEQRFNVLDRERHVFTVAHVDGVLDGIHFCSADLVAHGLECYGGVDELGGMVWCGAGDPTWRRVGFEVLVPAGEMPPYYGEQVPPGQLAALIGTLPVTAMAWVPDAD